MSINHVMRGSQKRTCPVCGALPLHECKQATRREIDRAIVADEKDYLESHLIATLFALRDKHPDSQLYRDMVSIVNGTHYAVARDLTKEVPAFLRKQAD